MSEPITETFSIPDYRSNFKNWLFDCAWLKEYNAIPLGIKRSRDKGEYAETWYYSIGDKNNTQIGTILFEVGYERTELLSVTATLVTRVETDEDGAERWVLDKTMYLTKYFRDLVKAIRKEYSITVPAKAANK